MGIVIRQSIKSTAWAYVGVALGTITTLWLYPKFLTPAQLGLTMGVMLPLASILAQFALLGTSNSSNYYASHFKNDAKHQPQFFQFLFRLMLIGLIVISLLYVFCKPWFVAHYSQHSALFIQYYWLVLPLTIFVVCYTFLEALIRSQMEIVFTNFTREVLLRLLTIASLALYIFKVINFQTFVILFVLAWAILFVALLFFSINKPWFKWTNNTAIDAVAAKKEIFRYGVFNVMSTAAWALASNIDSLMIAKYIGLNDTGVFRLAVFICSVIQMPQRTMTQIILPLLSEHWKNNVVDRIEELYKKSALQLIIAGSFLVMIVILNIDSFLQILPKDYAGAKWVVILLCIARLIDMATSINGEIIQTSKYYRFNFYFILALLVFTIVANYLLIPTYGIIGSAMAGMIVVILFNLFKYFFVWYKFKLQPITAACFYAVGLAAVVGVAVYFIPNIVNPYFTILIKSSIATLLFGLSLLQLKISPEINHLIKKVISFKF